VFIHFVLQNYLQNSAGGGKANKHAAAQAKQRKLPKYSFGHMLSSFRSWVAKLQPAGGSAKVWQDYAQAHSHTDDEVTAKRAVIQRFTAQHSPAMLWDLGCKYGGLFESGPRSRRGLGRWL